MSETRRVDEKGRITLPKEIRERLSLDAGTEVTLELDDGSVRVAPHVDREAARERLRGCINAETRAEATEDLDPEDLKRDWTSDLPR